MEVFSAVFVWFPHTNSDPNRIIIRSEFQCDYKIIRQFIDGFKIKMTFCLQIGMWNFKGCLPSWVAKV